MPTEIAPAGGELRQAAELFDGTASRGQSVLQRKFIEWQ
jgi:hypothetical protein